MSELEQKSAISRANIQKFKSQQDFKYSKKKLQSMGKTVLCSNVDVSVCESVNKYTAIMIGADMQCVRVIHFVNIYIIYIINSLQDVK